MNCRYQLRTILHTLALVILSFGCVIGSLVPVHAQEVTESPVINGNTATDDNIQQFRRLLTDPDIQQWLQQAPTSAVADTDTTSFGGSMVELTDHIRTRIEEINHALVTAPDAPGIVATAWRSQISDSKSLRVITFIVIFLFIGAAIEWLYTQHTHFRLLDLELKKPDTLRQRLSTALYRALITLGGLTAFAIGSIGAFVSFEWPPVVDDIVLNILIIVLVVRVVSTVSRFFLSPRVKDLRLVPFSNQQSRSIQRWVTIVAFVGTTSFAVSSVFRQISSMSSSNVPPATGLAVDTIANLLWLLTVLLAISTIRKLFIPDKTPANGRYAALWPIYLGVLCVVVFALWLIDTPRLMWTAAIFGLLIPVMQLFRNWVDNLFDQAEKIDQLHGEYPATATATATQPALAGTEENDAKDANALTTTEPQAPEEVPTESTDEPEYADVHDYTVKTYEVYRPITRRLVRFCLVITAFITLAVSWDINIFALSSSPTPVGRLLKVVLDVVFVLLIADIIWVWAKSSIDRRLADYVPPVDGQAPGPEARMATLLPLLRTILMTTLLVMIIMSVLSAFGVNIGPLLAGAGVIGVAVGFGAQALVRDVVSGIFFLIDDAFRIGEYIEVDSLMGTVEHMSIRSLRIRHHRGAIHTIPFGELKALTNYSRDWVIMKLEFRVPFDTDLKLVKKLVKNIGAELQSNPDYGHSIIQPLKSQGVRRMEEFNMVVGVKFMAKPGEQWVVRRDAYQKVRDAFDANGIVFAERNVKVEVTSSQPLDEATEKAATAAAHQLMEPTEPPKAAPDEP